MKFKVLKDFISSIVNGVEGAIHDLELDESTSKMWTEHGLIEEVKEEPAAAETVNIDSTPATESAPTPDPEAVNDAAPAPTAEPTPKATESAPLEAVTVDETK